MGTTWISWGGRATSVEYEFDPDEVEDESDETLPGLVGVEIVNLTHRKNRMATKLVDMVSPILQ